MGVGGRRRRREESTVSSETFELCTIVISHGFYPLNLKVTGKGKLHFSVLHTSCLKARRFRRSKICSRPWAAANESGKTNKQTKNTEANVDQNKQKMVNDCNKCTLIRPFPEGSDLLSDSIVKSDLAVGTGTQRSGPVKSRNVYELLPSPTTESHSRSRPLKAPIHLLTRSCDQISCCWKPVERTKEIGLEIISLVRSTGFLRRLMGLHDRARKWIGAFTLLKSHSASESKKFFRKDRRHVGGVYTKAVFREYEDITFTKQKTRGPKETHLGLLGPVLRLQVGDALALTLKNNADMAFSINPHGAAILKQWEGALYNDSSLNIGEWQLWSDSEESRGDRVFVFIFCILVSGNCGLTVKRAEETESLCLYFILW